MDIGDLGISKEEAAHRVTELLADRLNEDCGRKIVEEARETVALSVKSTAVQVVTDEAQKVLNGTFQPVNVFGEKDGKPTTIREHLATEVQEWWGTKVDYNGNPSKGYGRHPQTRAQYMAKVAVKEIVDKTLQDLIDSIRKEVVVELKQQIAKNLADSVLNNLR